MKTRCLIGFAVLLAMVACHHSVQDNEPAETPSHELSAIDSLMWRQPDSALAVLMDYLSDDGRDGVHTVSTNETFDNHYTQLLVSELLYKNDYKQTNREDLLQAVSYFDSLTLVLGERPHAFWRHCGLDPQSPKPNDDIVFLDARAHYINGVGYYEKDSVVEACKEYLKALEVMEEHFEEKELLGYKAQFMALTYTRLTDLFSNLYLHEQAIHFGKLSLKYYQKYNPESWHIAWILEEIGSHYDMMDSFDSASYYYQKASHTLQDTNSLSYRDISTHRALLSYNMEKNADAALSQLFDILSRSESEKESLARCAIIGEIFYTEKQYDSAWVYLNKVFHESPILDSKKQAAEWLVEISKVQNRETEILEYADFLVPFANLNENQSSIKSQMATLYHEYEQKRIDSRHQQKMSKNQKKANKAIGLLLGIITIVFVLYLVSKKRHYKVKKQNEETEHQLKIERQAHKMEQAALAGRLRKSNNALVQQKEEKEHLLKTLRTHQEQSGWNSLDDFMNEDICKEIISLLNGKEIKRESKVGSYPELQLSRVQLSNLYVAVEKHFSGFGKILTDLSPKTTREELCQCWLYLLDLEDVQIAHLLFCDYSTVKKRSKKMKGNFGIEKDPRQFIREFVL